MGEKREADGSYEKDMFEIEKSNRRQAAVRSLEPGKIYTLYTPPNKAEGIYTKAVAKRRKLIHLYPGHARFEKRIRCHASYESFTYGELAIILKKPDQTKIIREEEDE